MEMAQRAWGPSRIVRGRGTPPGFGLALPTAGPLATAQNIMDAAVLAESLGLDGVWANDRYSTSEAQRYRFPVGSVEAAQGTHPTCFEVLATLASVGGRVREIGLGAYAIVLPVREIRLFTKQIATLQELAGGRLTIAPGIGSPNNFLVMGVPRTDRGRRLDEGLDAMATILGSEHPVSYDGEYTAFRDATFYPRPQSIRLWITGDSEHAIRRTVAHGTGWFSTSEKMEQFPALLDRLGELAGAAGRDAAEIDRATDIFVCITDSTREAQAMSKATLEYRFGSMGEGLDRAAIGDTSAVTEHFRRRLAMGYSYVVLRFICHDVASYHEMIARVAREVLPALREPAAAT
jgi:alkanesulfonate monooxygenase SsuD/methylene tetrahydromethanopterin reductase-like flavin-dependent oxidoreductase (luciferase family)